MIDFRQMGSEDGRTEPIRKGVPVSSLDALGCYYYYYYYYYYLLSAISVFTVT